MLTSSWTFSVNFHFDNGLKMKWAHAWWACTGSHSSTGDGSDSFPFECHRRERCQKITCILVVIFFFTPHCFRCQFSWVYWEGNIFAGCWERNLDRIVIPHVGGRREGGRRGTRASFCQTHTSMSFVHCVLCLKRPFSSCWQLSVWMINTKMLQSAHDWSV